MRIIGTLERPVWKITLFKMDNKFSIKFEDRFLEQTYKFRVGEQIPDEQALRRLVDESFLEGVQQQFEHMQHLHRQVLDSQTPLAFEEPFPDIL